MNHHGCPKIRDLVDPEADEDLWICPSTQDQTSLSRAQNKIAWSIDNEAFEVVDFVL